MKRIICISNSNIKYNSNMYNLQLIGLCKSLVDNGYDCDVVFVEKKDDESEEYLYSNNLNKLKLIKMSALRIKGQIIYNKVLSKKYLKKYDIIISTECHQLMSFLLSLLYGYKTYIYHGPYQEIYNNFTNFSFYKKIFYRLYDFVLLPIIDKKVKKIFSKSILAENFLISKGVKNVVTIGVGLDIDKFDNKENEKNFHKIDALQKYENYIKVLYIGTLEERRNIKFIMDIFYLLKLKIKNIKLIIIGMGEKNYIEECFKYSKLKGIYEDIIYFEKIMQSEISYIYKNVDIFLLPTQYEIFGMVMLESMYFEVPIITTINGGSSMLINNGVNGFIIPELCQEIWAEVAFDLINDIQLKLSIIKNAKRTIMEKFLWGSIVKNLIYYFDNENNLKT